MTYDNRGVVEHQIQQWIRDKVLVKKLDCRRLVLRHVTMEGRPQGDVDQYDVPVGDLTPAHDVDVIAGQIMAAAQADADAVGGSVQMYSLYAACKNSDHTPRKVFRVSPQAADFDRDVQPSEPPNDKGMAAQAMRHLEAVMRTSVSSQGYLFSLLERQVQRLQDKDERADQQKIDMMMLVQDVIDGAHSRRLAERKEESSQTMRESAMDYLKVAGPILINRIAGKPVLPEKNKSFMLMASLLENLCPEQQDFLRNSLDPAQLTVLAEILAEYEKDKSTFEGSGPREKDAPAAPGNALPKSSEEESPKTPKIFQSVRERLADGGGETKDPLLRRLEERGKSFTRHLTTNNNKDDE